MRYMKIPEPVTIRDLVTGEASQVMTFLRTAVMVPLANHSVWGASMDTLFVHRKVREKLEEADRQQGILEPLYVALEDEEHRMLESALTSRDGLASSGVLISPNKESQLLPHYEAIVHVMRDRPDGYVVHGPGEVVAPL